MATILGRSSRRAWSPTLTREVAPGIHRLTHASINCYLIEDGPRLALVDAALPATWPHVKRAIRALGHTVDDVEAILLTHAHPDHLGFAHRAQLEWDVPVLAHEQETSRAASPGGSGSERPPLFGSLRHRRAMTLLMVWARAGALRVEPVTELEHLDDGATLDLPGRPTVVFTPGHTGGHCAFHYRAASALIAGDALVTLNPLGGATGPQLLTGADRELALHSLGALVATEAAIVLPGHGTSWRNGIASAVELAGR